MSRSGEGVALFAWKEAVTGSEALRVMAASLRVGTGTSRRTGEAPTSPTS